MYCVLCSQHNSTWVLPNICLEVAESNQIKSYQMHVHAFFSIIIIRTFLFDFKPIWNAWANKSKWISHNNKSMRYNHKREYHRWIVKHHTSAIVFFAHEKKTAPTSQHLFGARTVGSFQFMFEFQWDKNDMIGSMLWRQLDLLRFASILLGNTEILTQHKIWSYRFWMAFICADKVLWFLWEIENRLCWKFSRRRK